MRRVLVGVLCFISVGSFAQIRLGVQAGYNSSNFYTPTTTSVSISTISAFQAGLYGEKQLNSTFFVQSALQWAGKGGYKAKDQALFGPTTTLRMNYLQIPLNIGLKVKIKKDWKIYAATGLYGAYGVSGTEKGYNVSSPNGTVVPIDRKIKFSTNIADQANNTYAKPFDFGYNVLAGVEWKTFQLSANYNRGFKNAFSTGDVKYANQVLNFSLAYFIFIVK